MKKYLYKDSFILGIVLGAVLPWILFAVLYLLNMTIRDRILHIPLLITTPTLQLVAIVVNVFIMRQYLVKLKFDKTGRGLLIMTFVYILAYFANEFLISKS